MKTSTAMQIIKKQGLRTLSEVVGFFKEKGKDLTVFEQSFLSRMAKDGNLTSKELGIDTIVSYRKALIQRQKGVTARAD